MDPWIEGIRVILERSPTQSLPLSALHQRLKVEGGLVASRSSEWLRQTVERRPDLFRVVRTLRGPWASGVWKGTRGSGPAGAVPEGSGRDDDPWVIYLHNVRNPSRREDDAIRRLQESLQSVGKEMDEDSPSAVGRWIRAATEAEAVYSALCSSSVVPTRRAIVTHSPSRSTRRTVNPALRAANSNFPSSSKRRPLDTSHPSVVKLR